MCIHQSILNFLYLSNKMLKVGNVQQYIREHLFPRAIFHCYGGGASLLKTSHGVCGDCGIVFKNYHNCRPCKALWIRWVGVTSQRTFRIDMIKLVRVDGVCCLQCVRHSSSEHVYQTHDVSIEYQYDAVAERTKECRDM